MLSWSVSEFWTCWAALATTAVVVVGAWQIMALRRQTKGWQTLCICEKYDLDPVLDGCLRRLTEAKQNGKYDKDPSLYYLDIATVLNYLDGIAIGVQQNLYVESIVWDHLEPIFLEHVDDYLTPVKSAKIGIDSRSYKHLIVLAQKWGDKRTKFWDGWLLLRPK